MIRRILVATALVATPLAAQAQSANPQGMMHHMVQDQSPLLSFSITEEMRTAPDRARISAGVMTQATTAVDAMRENSQRVDAMVATLRRAGIAQNDIQTSGFSLSPQYDYRPQQQGLPPRLIGYQVSNQLSVTTADTTRIGALIDALVSAGGTNIGGPEFFVAEPDAMLDTARDTAMRRAMERAERYARSAGYARARLVSVSEGGGFMPPPMPVMARMDAAEASGGNYVQPGQVANGITLNVQFRLER